MERVLQGAHSVIRTQSARRVEQFNDLLRSQRRCGGGTQEGCSWRKMRDAARAPINLSSTGESADGGRLIIIVSKRPR